MHCCCQLFLWGKIKAIYEEMWLRDFHLTFIKNRDVHKAIHVNEIGCKFITFGNIDVCCMAWYNIHGVSKHNFIDKVSMIRKATGLVIMEM